MHGRWPLDDRGSVATRDCSTRTASFLTLLLMIKTIVNHKQGIYLYPKSTSASHILHTLIFNLFFLLLIFISGDYAHFVAQL